MIHLVVQTLQPVLPQVQARILQVQARPLRYRALPPPAQVRLLNRQVVRILTPVL